MVRSKSAPCFLVEDSFIDSRNTPLPAVMRGGSLVGILYTIEGISRWAIGQEFRFVWP